MTDLAQSLKELAQGYQQRIEAINRDLSRSHSASFTEQASERSNDSVLHALLAEAQHELVAAQQALARLEAGHYGQCSACGEPIEAARLAALPAAALCLGCASKL